MTGLDYFVLIVVLISTVSGAAKGLVRSLFSFGAVVVGLILALVFYDDLTRLYRFCGVSQTSASLLGFVTPIVVTVIAGAFVSHRIRKALKRTGLNTVDTAAGAALGMVRAWLVCSACYLALTAFPVRLHMVEQARTGTLLAWGARALTLVASQDLAGQFERGVQDLRRLKAGEASNPSKQTHSTSSGNK